MAKTDQTFMNEERSPLLWKPDPPGLFLGSAGHLRLNKGPIPETFDTYYVTVLWGISGQIAVQALDREYLLIENRVCLLDHSNRFSIDIRSHIGEFLYFTVDGDESREVMTRLDLWEGLFRAGPPPLGNIQTIMTQMQEISDSGVRVNLVNGMDLLRRICRTHRSTARNMQVLEAETFIRRQWKDPLFSIDRLCDSLGLNKPSVSRHFKTETGKSMLEYLHIIRIKAAILYLKETPLNISEIAYKCGFSDAAYFSRFIRKKTGKAPLEYRNS